MKINKQYYNKINEITNNKCIKRIIKKTYIYV